MLLYSMFYRHHGVRRWSELTSPRIAVLSDLGLPRNSIFHYLPLDEIEKGPSPDDPIFSKVERNIFVGHATDLHTKEGNPRSNRVIPDSEVRRFHRQHREFRRLIKIESALRDSRTLLVWNYALLQHLYRYIPSAFSRHYRWTNIQATVWHQVGELVKLSPERHHFLRIVLPERLPTLSQLLRAESNLTRSTLEPFRTDAEFSLLDLWLWLGEQREKSTMAALPETALEKINLIFYDTGRWFVINLGLLNSFRAATEEEATDEKDESGGKAPFTVQKYFLRAMMALMETRTLSGLTDQTSLDVDPEPEKKAKTSSSELGDTDGEADDDHDPLKELDELFNFDLAIIEEDGEEPLDSLPTDQDPSRKQASEPTTPATLDVDELLEEEARLTADLDRLDALIQKQRSSQEINYLDAQALTYDPPPEEWLKKDIETLADSGMLSGAEYRRLEKLTGRYKTIPNPLGEGTLADLATVKPEQVALKESTPLVELDTVLDKSMLKSTLAEFDERYIREVLPRDIASAVVNIQKAGVIVTDYEVEEVQDAINHYQSYAVRIVPVAGSPSTIRFRLPVVKEDGTYLVNGVKYRLRKQRGDQKKSSYLRGL